MRIDSWLRILAALLALLGVIPFANLLTGGTAVVWWNVVLRDWLVRGGVVLAIAALAAVVAMPRVDRVIEWGASLVRRPSPRAFATAAAALAGCGALAMAWYCFSGHPFTSDEMAHQWHARILLGTRFSAVTEQWPEFFNTAPVWDRDGRWYSQYPVGGPAFIALGMIFSAAWLVNPFLVAVAAWNLYGFAHRTVGDPIARTTTILFAVSPMVLIMGGSQMNHVPVVALALVALNALARWDDRLTTDSRGRARDAAIIGAAIGVAATVRPLDAALVAAVVGVFQLWQAAGDRSRWPSLGVQALAGAIPVAILLLANARTTGAPLLFGYDALNGPEHGLGFHLDPNGQEHTPLRGLAYASGYLLRLSRYLFEWPLPGMLFIVAGMATLRRPRRWDALLAALILGFLVAYAAYWFDGFFAGPRFLFTAAPAFVYFAARAVGAINRIADPRVRAALRLVVPLCVLAAWVGPRGENSALARAKVYHDQRTKLKTDVAGQVERAGLSNALVFVNEGWRGRLLARLRVLGASAFRAERIVNTTDACALGEALDAVERLAATPDSVRLDLVVRRARGHGEARLVTGVQADQAVAIVPGSRPSPACFAEYQRDTAGTMPYPPFLALNRLDRDGRVGGDVVFARDLGPRNALLLERFGARRWYRYRPPTSPGDTTNPFIPIVLSAPASP